MILIFAVLYVLLNDGRGLTRCYKTAVFVTFIICSVEKVHISKRRFSACAEVKSMHVQLGVFVAYLC